MADEERVVKKGSGGGLISLVTLVLVVLSVGISALSLMVVVGMKSSVDNLIQEEPTSDAVPGEVDVLQIETFSFTDQFIFQYKNEEDESDTVITKIHIGVLMNEDTAKDADTLLALMASKETIIKDGIMTQMASESYGDWQTPEGIEQIKSNLLTYLRERLVSELIIEVYLDGTLTQNG